MVAAARHTLAQREWIVRRLAAFETPKDVAAAFVVRFPDTACSEADVLATDPRIAVVPPDLAELFHSERRRVAADPDAAIYAEQNARLIVLSRQVDRYLANNQPAEARTVLRQIAEEVGAMGAGAAKAGKGGAVEQTEPVGEIVRRVVHPPAVAEADR